jgi:hypothetical protein
MLEIEVFSHSRPQDLSPLFTVDMPTARRRSDADRWMPCRRHAGGTTQSRASHPNPHIGYQGGGAGLPGGEPGGSARTAVEVITAVPSARPMQTAMTSAVSVLLKPMTHPPRAHDNAHGA